MSDKKHIILIDDEPIIHMSLEMILFGSNYRKTSIIDPDEAMQYSKSKDKYDKPDLLIIDLMMGHVSGLDVIYSIRSNTYFDNTPIILYTGYREQIINEDEMSKELNIACVLSKMIYKDDLLRIIDSLISSSN